MTDNERTQGRVLSEIEISHVDTFSKLALGSVDEREVATARLCLKLIATIHERDKTMAELTKERDEWKATALRAVQILDSIEDKVDAINGAVNKIKAITVSEKEVTEGTAPPSEPTI